MTSFYETYAALHILIDMDEVGTYATLPSEKDITTSYRIDVCESGDVPVATFCNCNARTCCKHLRIVTAYYARIYDVFSNHEKEETMNIPLTTDIDLSQLSPEEAQGLAELDALIDLALTEELPVQDDETPGQTLDQARVARRARGNTAQISPEHLVILKEEDRLLASRVFDAKCIEAAPLTKHAGFHCLLNKGA